MSALRETAGERNLAEPIRASRRRAPMPSHQVAVRFLVFAAMVLVALTYPEVLVIGTGLVLIYRNLIGRRP